MLYLRPWVSSLNYWWLFMFLFLNGSFLKEKRRKRRFLNYRLLLYHVWLIRDPTSFKVTRFIKAFLLIKFSGATIHFKRYQAVHFKYTVLFGCENFAKKIWWFLFHLFFLFSTFFWVPRVFSRRGFKSTPAPWVRELVLWYLTYQQIFRL